MKKNLLRKIVTATIAATTITSFSSLGVSAATIDSTYNNYFNNYYTQMANNLKNTGWVNNNGNWYFLNNAGEIQTGVIKINGQTYCLNQSGKMEIGKVLVNNRVYTTNQSGQVVGTKTPTVDKVFDSNNNVLKDNNKTSTVTNTTNNSGQTTTKTTTTKGSTNTGSNTTTTNTNTGSTATTGTTSTTSTSATSIDMQGLPTLPSNYSITVQAAAEQKILELMNQKRTEAGLKPLTLDNTLIKVARYKSDNMIQNNFFDHTNPDGTKWTDWLHALGYSYTSTGENIAYNTYDAVELFTQWWNSPGHRANMMNSSYNKVGIGVILGNGKYMGTQEFSN